MPVTVTRVVRSREAARDVDAEIQLIGIQGHFPRSDEVLEAMGAMLEDAGFNTSMRIVETGLYRQYRDKPRLDEGPVILQANHDNTTGDAAATLGRHLCSSNRNPVCDDKLDELIKSGMEAEGEEREEIWKEVARYMHEEVMVDILMAHLVGYARVGPRIEFSVEGRLPGVERFFKRNLDRELDNLEAALREELGVTA